MIISSANDYQEAARRRLPRFCLITLDGAYAKYTLKRNVEVLASIALRQKEMRVAMTLTSANRIQDIGIVGCRVKDRAN